MKTYKITFKLNSGIAFTDKPLFDGLIAYAHMREKLGKDFSQKLNIDKKDLFDIHELPLEIHEKGYPIASVMFWNEKEAIQDTQHWRKRWAAKNDKIADFKGKKKKVRINAGEFKSYDMPLSVMHVNQVWFYFRTGHISLINQLIEKWIHFIGKKRAQGYGEIDSFSIEKSNFDFLKYYRPIPVEQKDIQNLSGGMKIHYRSWRPPYWLPENYAYCIVE